MQERLQPFHVCRYKTGISSIPYERYKEEILSDAPYASVFYDIVLDWEIETLTSFVKGRVRARVIVVSVVVVSVIVALIVIVSVVIVIVIFFSFLSAFLHRKGSVCDRF